MFDKSYLRQSLRKKRNALSAQRQQQHAQQIAQLIENTVLWKTSEHIGLYHARDGEVLTTPLIQRIWTTQKKIAYLPKIMDATQRLMHFVPWHEDQSLILDEYNLLLPENSDKTSISGCSIPLILTPLVSFDEFGSRLGMGGGYYDKTFEAPETRPILIGLAHSLQYSSTPLPKQMWDVPLDAVITEKKCLGFTQRGCAALNS